MNQYPSPHNKEKFKFTEIVPVMGLIVMLYFIIHSLYSYNRNELINLRDQSWKIITIDMVQPYHYEIHKMKHDHVLHIYDGNSEIYSTICGYTTIQLCKDEFPVPSGKIKKIEFYKSSNNENSNLPTVLRIKSIQYLDRNNLQQSISLKAEFPNTKKAINKQKWKLGFSTFIAIWFFLFLVYLTSIFTIAPLFVRQLIYIFLAGNIIYLSLDTIIILI